MNKSYSNKDRLATIGMWNSGVPSAHIERFLGIDYPASVLIRHWRSLEQFSIASRSERARAVEQWKRTHSDSKKKDKAVASPWEEVYSELRAKSGGRAVAAIGDSTVEIVITILVDGEEVSRQTTTVLKPETEAKKGGQAWTK